MTIKIPSLLAAAGGEIVGKVRLQKAVYLLDQMGMNSGFSYDYHHYGPYSAELADRLDEAGVFGKVVEEPRRRASDGVPYSVFRIADSAEIAQDDGLGELSWEQARDALAAMDRRSATVLELAATIHWLAVHEKVGDWHAELVRRKGIKASDGRDDQALQLLEELGLAPAA